MSNYPLVFPKKNKNYLLVAGSVLTMDKKNKSILHFSSSLSSIWTQTLHDQIQLSFIFLDQNNACMFSHSKSFVELLRTWN